MIWLGIIVNNVCYTVLLAAWVARSVPHSGEGGWLSLEYNLRISDDMPIVLLAASTWGCFTDFYVLAIPISTVVSLRMSPTKKVAVCALFVAGLL
jgi:hypothetical protein